MKAIIVSWKLPAFLGIIMCSLVPVLLIYVIDSIDFKNSKWATVPSPEKKPSVAHSAWF
jgi:hypothetical protein